MSDHAEPQNPELAKHEKFYSRVREQVHAENTLYNQRIIWLITMQAFLFATLALVLQANFSENMQNNQFIFDSVFALISITGIMVALISNKVLNNAREVLIYLGKTWDKHAEKIPEHEKSLFPHPKGRDDSGEKTPHWLFRSGNLPSVFVVVWFLFLAILFASKTIVY